MTDLQAAQASGDRPRGLLLRLGLVCSRRAGVVVVAWLVLVAALLVANHRAGGSFTDDFSLPGTSAQQGADLLDAHEPSAAGTASQIVLRAPSGSVADDEDAVRRSAAALTDVPHVVGVSEPFAAGTVSADGATALLTVRLDTNPSSEGSALVDDVDHALQPARDAGLDVDYSGQLGQAADPRASDRTSEAVGLGVALVVLLVAFGSVLGAGIPLVSAAVGGIAGMSLLGLAAASVTLASVSPTLAVMMGLGVGIDYALFLTTRFRRLVQDGVPADEALGRALSTSGRSTVVAALTVVVALLGLYASGVSFIGRLGVAGGIGVAVAAVAALTLAPALLGLAGRRIDRWHVRRPLSEPSGTGDAWQRHADRVGRRPGLLLAAGTAVLLVLAIPVLSLRLGHVGAGANPTSTTDRRAYDAVDAAFGPGANAQLTVVAELPSGADDADRQRTADALHDSLAGTPGVASVGTPRASKDGVILVTTVTPATGPQDAATDALVRTLADDTLPAALGPEHAQGYVTGTTAAQLEFRDVLAQRLPLIIGIVVLAAFVLLLVVFRGVLVALTAAVVNLLSIAASYGVLVAVFQWGWGSSLLGVDGTVPIESYVPMMMFAIVFGLSMDYEIFLLFRVRESWTRCHDNRRAVASGLSATGRVITSAALIMASVFSAFLLSSSVVVKMLALGLAVSVVIDATVVRTVLVPSTMVLLGRANWWIPRWLDRLLPSFDPEPSDAAPSGHPGADPGALVVPGHRTRFRSS